MLSLNIEALFLPRESLALFFTLEEFATFSDSLSFGLKIDQLPILWKFTCFQTSWLIFSYVCNKWLLTIFFSDMTTYLFDKNILTFWQLFYLLTWLFYPFDGNILTFWHNILSSDENSLFFRHNYFLSWISFSKLSSTVNGDCCSSTGRSKLNLWILRVTTTSLFPV